MSSPDYQAHDLLWVEAGAVETDGPWPGWADAAWMRQAPVVVRREAAGAGRTPVGVRGLARSQRCKAYVPAAAVIRRVTPEMLAADMPRSALRQQHDSANAPSAVAAGLDAAADILRTTGLAWGPTGGVGFYLATSLPVLRADSDLDILVRAPAPLAPGHVATLAALLQSVPCRLDVQIDTGHGAFALAEWLRGGRVMLKTAAGPVLCGDPWQVP